MTSLKFMELVIGSFFMVSSLAQFYTRITFWRDYNGKTTVQYVRFPSTQQCIYVRQLYHTIHSEIYFLRIERVLKMYAR